jgi:S1-C subfamily serine protease
VVYLEVQVAQGHPSAAMLGTERMGAGVAVGPDRILTVHYLVLGASRVTVFGLDGRERRVTRIALDHDSGLALLSLEGVDLQPATLVSGKALLGAPVFLLTATSRDERKGATGHITSVGPFEAFWEYAIDRAIMTTAVNPGLAGAPLFDALGQVIATVSLGLTSVGRYSLAIPVELYLDRATELEAHGEARATPRRSWIGIYPLAQESEVILTGVVAGGPADTAGLSRGDSIVTVDGHPVSGLRELYEALWRRQPGEPITLQVLRGKDIRVVEVRSSDRYTFYR